MFKSRKSTKTKTSKTFKDISERILYSAGRLAGSISADLRSFSKPFADGFVKGKKS